jgi:Concanavalin A-like lectin/glucanases superfamily
MNPAGDPAGQHGNNGQMAGKQSPTENQGWAVDFNDNGTLHASLWVYDGTTSRIEYTSALSLGQWYHLVFVVDRSSNVLREYINGVEDVADDGQSIAG